MSEENKTQHSEQESQILDFEKAQQMTIGEAVRKDLEIKAGVTEDDNVLDKYIKQHREEVVSQKFETKLSDFEKLDTGSLDDFIKKQRVELENGGFLDNQVDDSEKIEEEIEKKEVSTVVPVQEPSATTLEPVVANASETEEDQEEQMITLGDVKSTPFYKTKGAIIGGLIALVLAIFGIAYGMNNLNGSNSKATPTSSSSTSTSTESSSDVKAKADRNAFNDLYETFFTDENLTDVKNSEFDNLSNLEAALKKLEGTDYYDDAKAKYDSLNKQITAIKAVNNLFESDTIVDGNKVSATVKSDADIDALPSGTLNTGNASLDTTLQSAISDGRKQLASGQESTTDTSVATPVESAPATSSAPAAEVAPAPAETTPATPSVSAATSYGITQYDPSILQRHLSRVPYNDSAIADSGNSAWVFGEGILEKIIAISNERGYFSGNNFILERVNIINGNGYYNMFKADGTYLFSINCKTGYFVGNAKGNSDDLDY